jgi:hypothetical protein
MVQKFTKNKLYKNERNDINQNKKIWPFNNWNKSWKLSEKTTVYELGELSCFKARWAESEWLCWCRCLWQPVFIEIKIFKQVLSVIMLHSMRNRKILVLNARCITQIRADTKAIIAFWRRLVSLSKSFPAFWKKNRRKCGELSSAQNCLYN